MRIWKISTRSNRTPASATEDLAVSRPASRTPWQAWTTPPADRASARENGIEIKFGDPNVEDKPGVNIVLPKDPSYIKTMDMDLNRMRTSFIKKACKKYGSFDLDEDDINFLAEEVNASPEWVRGVVEDLK